MVQVPLGSAEHSALSVGASAVCGAGARAGLGSVPWGSAVSSALLSCPPALSSCGSLGCQSRSRSRPAGSARSVCPVPVRSECGSSRNGERKAQRGPKRSFRGSDSGRAPRVCEGPGPRPRARPARRWRCRSSQCAAGRPRDALRAAGRGAAQPQRCRGPGTAGASRPPLAPSRQRAPGAPLRQPPWWPRIIPATCPPRGRISPWKRRR